MTRHHGFVRSIAITAACTVGLVLVLRAAAPPNFKPDGTFKGSALTGWKVVGDADWSAQNGELIGKAKPGTNGGWLVMDKAFQDVQLYMNYKCTGECKSGVLLRAKKTADGGMTGVFVSLSGSDTGYYSVTLDATGKETAREALTARGGRTGRRRQCSSARWWWRRSCRRTRRCRARGHHRRRRLQPLHRRQRRQVLRRKRHLRGTRHAGWQRRPRSPDVESDRVERDVHHHRQRGTEREHDRGANPRVLDVRPRGERAGRREERVRVRQRRVVCRRNRRSARQGFRVERSEQCRDERGEVVSRYAIHRLSPTNYGWGATTSDVNNDGTLDVIAGPFYYLGPSFTDQRRYRDGTIENPEPSFAPDMVNLSADFTGDGYPDVLSTVSTPQWLVCQPARRIAPLGQVLRAADDLERNRADEGPQQGRQAGDHLRPGRT